MNKKHINFGKRFSGADWADQTRNITLIGLGGIGSWTALSLGRIGHNLILVDGDCVDATNVGGGQIYRIHDVDESKSEALLEICREFGVCSVIVTYDEFYEKDCGAMGAI